MNFRLYRAGREIPAESFRVEGWDPEDPGIFESLRTYHGKFFRLREHLKRFRESARTLGRADGIRLEEVERELELARKAFESARSARKADIFFRITLWKGRVFVMAGERRHAPEIYRTGIALKTASVLRSHPAALPAQVKTTAYQSALMGFLEGGRAEENLFLDSHGFLAEARIGNLFIVREGRLCTPPARLILDGVTRRFVIECARASKITVLETPLTRHELFNASEAFLTNTSWEILPVRETDGRTIGSGVPGPVTRKLQRIFKKKVDEECR